MYSSVFVNFPIYVHICSSQIVFLSNSPCVHHTVVQVFSYAVVSNYPSNHISLVFYSIKHPLSTLVSTLL